MTTISLADGRKLAYEESGARDGKPVFFFHGWSSSRLLRHPDDTIASALGIRLITVDRPGAGLSDFQPNRTLLHWADDVAAVADHLSLDSFAVVGHSGAGPHALAVAKVLGDRVTRAVVASGFAPVDMPGAVASLSSEMRQGAALLAKLPFMAKLILRPMPARYRKDARAAFHGQFGKSLGEADRTALAPNAPLANVVYQAAAEAFRQGSRGAAHEMLLFLAKPWGFAAADVARPVTLFYGADDNVVPPAMGRMLAKALPKADLVEIPRAGHMAFLEHWPTLMRAAIA